MGQSLVHNYVHIVFSTKNLAPLILPKHEEALFEYLGGICRKLESPSLRVGGHLNHVHILCSVSRNISIILKRKWFGTFLLFLLPTIFVKKLHQCLGIASFFCLDIEQNKSA